MKTKFLTLYVSAGILFASCESKMDNSINNIEQTIEETSKKLDPEAEGGNKCLLDYANKYDQLLSEQRILELTGFSKDVMETEYSKVLDNVTYHSFEYKFTNKRMQKPFGMDMELPFRDNISVSNIKPISFNYFNNTYRAIASDEKTKIDEVTDEVLDGKSDNKDAKEAVKKLEETGVSKKEAKSVTKSLTNTISNISKAYQNVENLGDAARWNTLTKELVVVQNGAMFQLTVSVNDDVEKEKLIAIELAKDILKKCK